MSRVDVTYPEDAEARVRMRTTHSPSESMTAEEARQLASALLHAAEECDRSNGVP